MGWLTTSKRKRKPAGPAQPDQALNGGGTGAAPGAAAAPPAPARPGEAARTDAGAHEARGKAKYVELVDAVAGADADAAWAELPEGVRDLYSRLRGNQTSDASPSSLVDFHTGSYGSPSKPRTARCRRCARGRARGRPPRRPRRRRRRPTTRAPRAPPSLCGRADGATA